MDLRWIPHLSPAYALCVALRRAVLRQPLGLDFTELDLAAEGDTFHLACFEGDRLLGTLMLTPRGETVVQMRQVAVAEGRQGQGLGTLLVRESEAEARRRGFKTMTLHARDVAVPFYLNLGYACVGEPFTEVGIGHQEMEKTL